MATRPGGSDRVASKSATVAPATTLRLSPFTTIWISLGTRWLVYRERGESAQEVEFLGPATKDVPAPEGHALKRAPTRTGRS
jgi:hypothetical protein